MYYDLPKNVLYVIDISFNRAPLTRLITKNLEVKLQPLKTYKKEKNEPHNLLFSSYSSQTNNQPLFSNKQPTSSYFKLKYGHTQDLEARNNFSSAHSNAPG